MSKYPSKPETKGLQLAGARSSGASGRGSREQGLWGELVGMLLAAVGPPNIRDSSVLLPFCPNGHGPEFRRLFDTL